MDKGGQRRTKEIHLIPQDSMEHFREGVIIVRIKVFIKHCLKTLVARRLKRLPPMWETRVQSLGWEDPLEKEMVTHSNILA